uniref:StiJ protein n=1 Tax=Stigmatella aurantiaca TaxID=41 RepID=Q8RJX8_STIAU|nr:StiJ protein [Stigmatella aurantiaca Sg a15]
MSVKTKDNQDLLKRALVTIDKLQAKVDALERAKSEPIAVVGIGCRLPGGANDPESFFQMLREGRDATSDMPAERWDADAYYDPDPDAPLKMYTRRGGFLDQVDQFDPQFFGISPREAVSMDPAQRIFLEVCWEALERAGQAPDKLGGTRTGVFVGAGTEEYAHVIEAAGYCDTHTATGNIPGFVSGRISYLLGLTGPSVTLNTTCSSSLAAVHTAMQSLRAKECDMALAGGVNLILRVSPFVALCKIRMLSRDGRCKTFDASADGYGRSEGCGVVVLKRLSDAQRSGDHILALLRGSSMQQNGSTTSGITVTSVPAQQSLIREALANTGVEPSQVSYVEAHGTGTTLGDPIEVQAIASVVSEGRSADQPLMIGSVKANLGHSELAAGVTGLIKVVLSMHHEELPPYPSHLTQRNPAIAWNDLKVMLPTEITPWPRGNGRRFAGVNSLGGNGLNVHVVVEEAPLPSPVPVGLERPRHMFALSATRETALSALAGRYARHLAKHPSLSLADVCFTAGAGRSHFKHRAAFQATSVEQLRTQLEALAAGSGVRTRSAALRRSGRPKIAFLFTGQGSQYVGMGRALFETQPVFRRAILECEEVLRPILPKPLLSVLYPEVGQESPIDETEYTQPALFAVEYALATLWRSWGIEPSIVMGHSVGEYVAACVAGVFSLEEGLRLIAERGRLMSTLPRDGDMVAVFATEARVTAALAPVANDVSIAAVNGPEEIVISGARDGVNKVVEQLTAEGIKTRRLTVSHAFHSPLMSPIRSAFTEAASRVNYAAPRVRVISNITGRAAKGSELSQPSYWVEHVQAPVRFADGLRALHEHGCDAFLEVGPQATLLGLGKRCLPDAVQPWLPSLRKGHDEWESLLGSLGALYESGVDVDWAGFDRDYPRRRLPLPTYAFQRERYWVEPQEGAQVHVETRSFASARPLEEVPATVERSVEEEEPGLHLEALRLASPEVRNEEVSAWLRQLVSRVFKLAEADLDSQEPILNLGLDSLMAVDMKERIKRGFDIDLSLAELLEGPSIAALSERLGQMLEQATPRVLAVQAPAPSPTPVVRPRETAPSTGPKKAQGKRPVINHQCVGTWKLVSFESKTPDGRNFIDFVSKKTMRLALSALGSVLPSAMPMNFQPNAPVFYPFGPSPIGHLIYTAEGHYALDMGSQGRRGFGSEELATASPMAQRSALMTYISSSGKFTAEGDQVIHKVEAHLYPDEVGRDHAFTMEFDKNGRMIALKPTAPSPLFGGKSVLTYATWERV